MPGYFNFFPSTNYANNIVTNILAKARFDQSVQENFAIFYPYTIQQGERADIIAARVYEDPTLDWILYMSNNITDPYYDWPLSQEQFNRYIISKYGNLTNAEQIAFFRNNYYNDESFISPSAFNTLTTSHKKYYSPIIGYNNTIISYKRKELDVVLDTNKTISLTVSSSNGFVVGEKITQSSNSGYISYIGSNKITINRVTGDISNNSITGLKSGSTTSVTSSSTLNTSIPDSESSFYSPVTYLQYEEELNESKFNIRVLDKSYVGKIQRDMRELFK
ncbi:hypothetical protein EB118_02965 [bacterium]|nr:hypothetical protein [bacterium]